MCIAYPGKILKIEGTKATVDFSGNVIEAEAGLVQVQPGDSVLVHAGCIIQKLTDFDRDGLLSILSDMEEE